MTQTLSGPHETAIRLVQAGISVIPIGRVKQPACSWKPFQSRLATPEELASWYSEPERHGIGIVCGAVSGNLEVIDFDIRNLDTLRELVQRFLDNVAASCEDFPLQALAMVQTPGPGIQLYYRCKSPIGGNQKLARRPGEFDPETGTSRGSQYFIETRGEGGYVLSVGSPGHCHPTGGTYRHISGPAIHELQPVITNVQRDVLLCEARALGNQEQPEARKEAVSVLQAPEGSAGADFNQRASWAEILTPFGFEHVGRSGDVDQWRRPGTANPVSATTGYGDSDLFYAFSPNCGYGIEADRGYSKFAIYTHLNHGGDFTSAAKALGEQGYGSRPEMPQIDISAVLNPVEHDDQDYFGFQPFEEFMSGTEETEYLCTDIIAKGQSAIIGGPEKSLKTGIGAMDLGYSLATATPFLGRFECPKAVSVGIMTGETSKPKLRRQFETRMAFDSVLHPDRPNPRLFITTSLPDLSSTQSLEQIERTIGRHCLDVLIVDPAYLCLGSMSDHTSNLSKMGNMLRQLESVGKSTGCTLILLHHTNRKHETGKPLTLRDLSGAGFAEWARQWILLSPRQTFDPEAYQHRLWMVVGGSAGHAGRYAVDVREKDDHGEWAWITQVRTESEEKDGYQEAKVARKGKKESAKAEEFVSNLKEALQAGVKNGGSTVNELKRRFTDNKWPGVTKLTSKKLSELQEHGFVKVSEAKRGDNPSVQVWEPDGEWAH